MCLKFSWAYLIPYGTATYVKWNVHVLISSHIAAVCYKSENKQQ